MYSIIFAASLALTYCSFKLKFSPDKVDTMVVQAIALLDDLDKEINIYAMRVKVRNGQFPCFEDIINRQRVYRSGMAGISLRWPRFCRIIWHTRKS